jgi:hypothetical protein
MPISQSTATSLLPFYQLKNEVSQLSDVPVATALCVSFVINGFLRLGFSDFLVHFKVLLIVLLLVIA